MFNFKGYPELYNCHKKKKGLRNAMYKAEARFDRSGSKKDDELWESAITESQNFTLKVYSESIYTVFDEIKPVLFNRRLKQYVQWQSVYKNSFDKLSDDEKRGLVALVEEDGGLYRLPPEFYK